MTLREQIEAALEPLDECEMIETETVLDALLPVVEAAIAAERERCARILRKTASLMAGPTRSPPRSAPPSPARSRKGDKDDTRGQSSSMGFERGEERGD